MLPTLRMLYTGGYQQTSISKQIHKKHALCLRVNIKQFNPILNYYT